MKRSSPAGGRLDGLVSHSDSEDDFFERDEDSGDDGAPEEVVRSRESRGSGGGPSSTKKPRRDKHAPAEVSSKKRPPRFQTVVPVPKVVRRDPRFEETSGRYSASNFRNVYKFLDHEATRQSAEEAATTEWMKHERAARAKGKKAFYLSKRAKKELALGEKFKQLEAKGPEAVDKFLAKKRAKNASKDKKSLPWARPPRSREED